MTSRIQDVKGPRMRILAIVSNPAGWGDQAIVGGGEVRALRLLRIWSAWGQEVQTLELQPAPSRGLDIRCIVHEVRRPRIHWESARNFTVFLGFLFGALRLRRPGPVFDIVLAPTNNLSDVIPAFIASILFRRPFIVVFQIDRFGSSFRRTVELMSKVNKPGRALLRAMTGTLALGISKLASAVISISEPIAEMLVEAGVRPAHVFRSSGLADIRKIANVPPVAEDGSDASYLGRIEQGKGLSDLMRAWAIVCAKQPEATLIVIGSGSYLEGCKALAKQFGIFDNVTFAGKIETDDRFALVKGTRVFLFPSPAEGFGLAILEAMACGIPVVCYARPARNFGALPLLHAVPDGDVEALSREALQLLADDRRRLDVKKIFEELKEFDSETVAAKELDLLRRVIAFWRG